MDLIIAIILNNLGSTIRDEKGLLVINIAIDRDIYGKDIKNKNGLYIPDTVDLYMTCNKLASMGIYITFLNSSEGIVKIEK